MACTRLKDTSSEPQGIPQDVGRGLEPRVEMNALSLNRVRYNRTATRRRSALNVRTSTRGDSILMSDRARDTHAKFTVQVGLLFSVQWLAQDGAERPGHTPAVVFQTLLRLPARVEPCLVSDRACRVGNESPRTYPS
jgi:hypothetical protein